MIEFLTIAAMLFAVTSAGVVVLIGTVNLLTLLFDAFREWFGDSAAFWVSAALFIAFISALVSGLILIGDGSGAQ